MSRIRNYRKRFKDHIRMALYCELKALMARQGAVPDVAQAIESYEQTGEISESLFVGLEAQERIGISRLEQLKRLEDLEEKTSTVVELPEAVEQPKAAEL